MLGVVLGAINVISFLARLNHGCRVPDFVFKLGPLGITRTVVTTWGIILVLTLVAWLVTRQLRVEQPGLVQTAAEGVVEAIQGAIRGILPDQSTELLPFVGTLWLFISVANLAGVIPGLQSPTGDLSTTVALALVVFFSVRLVRHPSRAGCAAISVTTSRRARSCCRFT